MNKSDRLILLTNDDGVGARGLIAMKNALAGFGRTIVVAPSEEKSASSHSLTIHHPVRIVPVAEDTYSVTGTPADCVLFAFRKILTRLPDLVVSGVNHGPNLGDDIFYSGTVGAARESALCGVPSIAVSVLSRTSETFQTAAGFVRRLLEWLDWEALPEGTFLNINVPCADSSDFRFTRQGAKRVSSAVEEKEDPRGRTYYWIGQDLSEWQVDADSDYQAVRDGLISVTPLQRDHTDYSSLRSLRSSVGRLEGSGVRR